MFKKVKNAGKTLKNIGTRSLSRHSLHQSEISIDPTPTQALSSSSDPRVKVLLKTGDLGLKTRREKEVFQQLKNKDFIHTPILDPILLQETVTPVNQRAPQRVASKRMTTHQERTWYGADPGPEEATYLHYRDYNPPSPSGPVGSTCSAAGADTGDMSRVPRSPVDKPTF